MAIFILLLFTETVIIVSILRWIICLVNGIRCTLQRIIIITINNNNNNSFYSFWNELNISKEEHVALKGLSTSKDLLIIQKSGKGNSVVLLNRNDYIKRMSEMLSDSSKGTFNRYVTHFLTKF